MVGLGKSVFERHDRTSTLGLSERERTVLELMASGSTNPEIADALHLSKHTVKEHTSGCTASSACATAPRPSSGPSDSVW